MRDHSCRPHSWAHRTPRPFLTQVAFGSYLRVHEIRWPEVLNNKLSEYVRLAAPGETVLVTDRDRVVAEIVPPGQSGALSSLTPFSPTPRARAG